MTDRDQCAFEEALRVDLAAARQEVMLLKDQLRSANTANEALSYKVDFLTQEVSRVTASREQYERISIRVSTFAESIGNVAIQQLQSLMDEIKAAAFTKVPGAVRSAPEAPISDLKGDAAVTPIVVPFGEVITAEQLGKTFGAGFGTSADLLPPARFGNGAAK